MKTRYVWLSVEVASSAFRFSSSAPYQQLGGERDQLVGAL
jgi:hypothetical protein